MAPTARIPQAAVELGKQLRELLELANRQEPRKAPQSPADQAADSLLNKRTKLGVAMEAALVGDANKLLEQDRKDVARLKEKHVFKGQQAGGAAGETMAGDIIVCDDYNASQNHGQSGKTPAALLAAIALLAGATGWSIWSLAKPAAPPDRPAVTAKQPATAYDAVYEVRQPDGTWKEVKRERLK